MWLYRRRRKELTPQQVAELEELLEAIPDLQLPYYFREEVTEIFDTAKNRQEALRRLEDVCELLADEPELLVAQVLRPLRSLAAGHSGLL